MPSNLAPITSIRTAMAGVETLDGDLFDGLLALEDEFYQEGYKLGEIDGERAGHLEGRAFGIEKGFEKYLEMGKLNGRALIWSGRLDCDQVSSSKENKPVSSSPGDATASSEVKPVSKGRLESHLRTLYALTEPESLSTENDEESVANFDDRLRRAHGKVKIIEKLVGDRELSSLSVDTSSSARPKLQNQQTNNIEDVSILHARH